MSPFELTLLHQASALRRVLALDSVSVVDEAAEASVRESISADSSADSEPQPEQASGIPVEEEVLSQASEDESEPHPADLGSVSPVGAASAGSPSSYTEASAEALTKLQIVEALLARQGGSPDSMSAQAIQLGRLTKSVLISRLLAESVP